MGLPMYVSPSLSKRQLPPKQPTSPPYTPQVEDDLEEAYQNSRTSAFGNGRDFVHRNPATSSLPIYSDIPEPRFVTQPETRSQRPRSTTLPYNVVQQHIQRLHQLHQIHRTREPSSNLASRRGLHSAHLLNLNRTQQQLLQQQAALRLQDRNLNSELAFAAARERLDENNDGGIQRHNNINDHINPSHRNHSSSAALDNVIRRVNLLRQHHESRFMRPSSSRHSSSRHHRSITGHTSGRSSNSRNSSSTVNLERRDELVQRGIDIPSSSTVRLPTSQLPEPTMLYPNEHNASPSPPVPRLSTWRHIRRGVNWPMDSQSQPQPQPIQRSERRSSFADDFYSTTNIPHHFGEVPDDHHHISRILSPIPRRYDARLSASLPNGNEHELLETNVDNRSNVDRVLNGNDSVRTEQRGSASGEVC
ncbi:13880_t:CDS:2 [Funneliformis caledonium]|uniref:13880_t:CDS:1 n=1 Tax=Funneliformis caledonium TaxID=1117310 RepID=A0A9N9A0Z0_9GLOM|nr:13880_t:CDS:2 [Funneliformis caledonium]